jgi:hypothetical protein
MKRDKSLVSMPGKGKMLVSGGKHGKSGGDLRIVKCTYEGRSSEEKINT